MSDFEDEWVSLDELMTRVNPHVRFRVALGEGSPMCHPLCNFWYSQEFPDDRKLSDVPIPVALAIRLLYEGLIFGPQEPADEFDLSVAWMVVDFKKVAFDELPENFWAIWATGGTPTVDLVWSPAGKRPWCAVSTVYENIAKAMGYVRVGHGHPHAVVWKKKSPGTTTEAGVLPATTTALI
jgi:hypothetical protein